MATGLPASWRSFSSSGTSRTECEPSARDHCPSKRGTCRHEVVGLRAIARKFGIRLVPLAEGVHAIEDLLDPLAQVRSNKGKPGLDLSGLTHAGVLESEVLVE